MRPTEQDCHCEVSTPWDSRNYNGIMRFDNEAIELRTCTVCLATMSRPIDPEIVKQADNDY